MANESEMKAYEGSCHCGAVRYQATATLEGAITCNCSICARTGSILAFIPAGNFELLSGAASLSDYQFGSKTIQHLFCSVCGIRSFAKGKTPDGTEMVAINVRCLDGVDLDALQPTKVDGKSL